MMVYLNGEQTGDPVRLPPSDRAFWIGYLLPSKGDLEVMITNFTIIGTSANVFGFDTFIIRIQGAQVKQQPYFEARIANCA